MKSFQDRFHWPAPPLVSRSNGSDRTTESGSGSRSLYGCELARHGRRQYGEWLLAFFLFCYKKFAYIVGVVMWCGVDFVVTISFKS